MSTLATIAFDIETTGFSTTDQLTIVGFDAEIGSRVFLNTDGGCVCLRYRTASERPSHHASDALCSRQ